SLHDLPVHEVVAGDRAGGECAPAVVRKDLVAEVEAHDARHRLLPVDDRQHLALRAEDLTQYLRIAPGEHRCTEVTQALRIDVVQATGARVDVRAQAFLQSLANHRTLFAWNGIHVGFRL